MLNETDPTITENANAEYSMENVVAFPGKNKQETAFRVPASAVTPRFSPEEGTIPNARRDEMILDNQRQNMIPELSDVIVREIFFRLYGMGFPVITEQAEIDFQFIYEAVQSALFRMYGVSHPLHEYVDANFELVPASMVDPNRPMEPSDTDPSETT